MEAWPNLQEVTVEPLTGGNGNRWNVGHKGHSSSNPNDYPHVNLPTDSGPYLIHFIINQPGYSVTFDSGDPVWVQPGSKPKTHTVDGQIAAVVTSSDGKELFVLDKNDNYPSPQTLYYQLNTKGHGNVDPIIDNGGTTRPPPPPPPPPPQGSTGQPAGSPPPPSATHGGIDWSCLVIGLVIGLMIGLALCWWRRKNAERSGA
jgi:hypothetical protein